MLLQRTPNISVNDPIMCRLHKGPIRVAVQPDRQAQGAHLLGGVDSSGFNQQNSVLSIVYRDINTVELSVLRFADDIGMLESENKAFGA